MSDIESIYKYAWKLFLDAKAFCDLSAIDSNLQKAYGAAYLAYTLDYPGAEELMNEIEDYAKKYGIKVS